MDWKKQKSLSDKIGWIIGLIFDLWILWVIVIPIAIFFAEIDAFLEVMFAKIFLKIWFGLLPIITLFAVLDFALIFWRFCFRVPRFKKKKKLRRKLMFLLVVIASNIADHYYHDEIQSFISNDEAEVELEVETDTEVEITTVLEPEAEVK